MIDYSESDKRMLLKLVYYGPAMSGKTTNLLTLHEQLTRDGRGELMVLDTTDDRTIYFDLLPFFLVAPSGLKIKLKVYTVPGQVKHDATRKAVLQRADGVVFVADSQVAEQATNAASFANLEENIALVGLDINTLPLVIQFNKRDLPNIIPADEILAKWQQTGLPVLFCSALTGEGVIETFAAIAGLVYDRLDEKYRLAARHHLSRESFIKQLCRRAET
jgi:signal recognition particle receptor subunit beta